MPDIFLSYSRQDQSIARRFAEGLEREGFSVWWDVALSPGEAYDQVTEQALEDSKAVLVLWSTKSVVSRWVRAEATQANQLGKLVPAMIEPCKRPIMFELIQTPDLSDWNGDPKDKGWQAYLAGVRRVVQKSDAPAASDDVLATSVPAPRRRTMLWSLLVPVFAVLLAAAIVWFVRDRFADRTDALTKVDSSPVADPATARRSGASGKPRIAVLPFENLSQDPNNAFFSEGLHEEILTALANGVSGLEVISRTTMDTYKGKQVSVEQIAKELNCTYVLEGSVRREGDSVRLTVQLVDARNDSQIWAENYDRKLVKAITLETEVAGAVASRLSFKVGRTVTQPTLTTDPIAYDLYLKARAALASGPAAQNTDTMDLLDRAIELDPAFVRAYAERIAFRVDQFLANDDPGEKKLALARQDLQRIVMLAPDDPVTTAAQSIMSYADMEYDHALELMNAAENAGLSDPRLLGYKSRLLFAMGRYQDATTLAARLAELDPKNGPVQAGWLFMLMELHQGKEAMQVAELGIASHPGDFGWQFERGNLIFQFTGNLAPSRQIFAGAIAQIKNQPRNSAADVHALLYELNLEHRFAEARQLIDTVTETVWRQQEWDWPVLRVGPTPVADDRGWEDMLLGDANQAHRDGERIVAFLRETPETRWNEWFRGLLRAEAQLFMGDKAAAIKSAEEAAALTSMRPDISDRTNAHVWAALIGAWAGSGDDASARLEAFSASIPGLWPGEVAYNPQWTLPLANDARYSQLRNRLIAQMKATRLQ